MTHRVHARQIMTIEYERAVIEPAVSVQPRSDIAWVYLI